MLQLALLDCDLRGHLVTCHPQIQRTRLDHREGPSDQCYVSYYSPMYFEILSLLFRVATFTTETTSTVDAPLLISSLSKTVVPDQISGVRIVSEVHFLEIRMRGNMCR
jgi:hypothetical protein